MDAAPDDLLHSVQERQLLWTELCQRLDPSEIHEVSLIVGSSLIDDNQVRLLMIHRQCS
jgi:hypothetical protein